MVRHSALRWCAVAALGLLSGAPVAGVDEPGGIRAPGVPLFNGKDLTGWDTWLGRPHPSVEALDLKKNDKGEYTENIGLNKDPKKVYTVVMEDGAPAIRISGEIFGALTTKVEYENYYLRCEFKWGEKRWAPRANTVRDSGILYHCVGEHGAAGTFWMQSQECQVQEKDCGDYWSVAGAIIDIPAEARYDVMLTATNNNQKLKLIKAVSEVNKKLGLKEAKDIVEGVPKRVVGGLTKDEAETAKKQLEDAGGTVELKAGGYRYSKGAEKVPFGPGGAGGVRCIKDPENEKPTGQWNLMEVFTVGQTSLHRVNGKVVMVLHNSRRKVDGKEVPLTKGKIQLQSEGAEVFYRNIVIDQIREIPAEYLK